MDERIEQVIETWFGPGAIPSQQIADRWFAKDPAFDDDLRTKLGPLQADAAAGLLDRWRESPRGELALIILLDQLPRNLYRDDRRAFLTDDVALSLARDVVASGRLRELPLIHRVFALMPFQHAETREAQHQGIGEYAALLDEARDKQPESLAMLQNVLSFAEKHRDIVEKFGRFPHRNGVLGRTSTVEELTFLEQPGSSF